MPAIFYHMGRTQSGTAVGHRAYMMAGALRRWAHGHATWGVLAINLEVACLG
jgi:hypothetical protein